MTGLYLFYLSTLPESHVQTSPCRKRAYNTHPPTNRSSQHQWKRQVPQSCCLATDKNLTASEDGRLLLMPMSKRLSVRLDAAACLAILLPLPPPRTDPLLVLPRRG